MVETNLSINTLKQSKVHYIIRHYFFLHIFRPQQTQFNYLQAPAGKKYVKIFSQNSSKYKNSKNWFLAHSVSRDRT